MCIRDRSRIAVSAALVFCCLAVAPTAAWADESAAETLFQEGLAAMKRSEYPVACEAFTQSNKADPSPGTQINLAICYEKQKKWASAWTWYRSAVGLAQQRGQAEREKLAEESAARIKPQIHYVVVSVKEPLTDLSVKRDGAEVTIAIAGKEVPLPIDPGEHKIEVSAKGKKPWSTVITVADDARTERIEVPKLEDAPVDTSVAAGGGGPGVEYRPPVIVTNDGSSQRTVGIIVGGAGVLAGLSAVGVFILAKSEEDKANEADKVTPGSGTSKRNAAENNQLIAQVLTGGAIVLVGVGAVLYLTAPKRADKAARRPLLVPVVGPSYAGVGLGGAF